MTKILDKITRAEIKEILQELNDVENDQKIDFSNNDLRGVDLSGLNLSVFNLENDIISLEGCILDKYVINQLQFSGRRNFQKIIIQDQDLGLDYTWDYQIGIGFNQGFFFDELNLSNTIFRNCNLNQATFKQCNLTNVVFENCSNIENARVINCTQQGTSHNIPEYIDADSLPQSKILQFIGRLISLQFLGNMLGDGGL
jgi:uncharacterized protein YjbI with pentapeptide repeats